MPEPLSWARDLRRYANLVVNKFVRPRISEDPIWPGPAKGVVSALRPGKMQLEVTEVIEETSSTRTLRFTRTDAPPPPFRAGQYMSLKVEVDGVETSRPYSISSRPGVPHLDITVREVPGAFVSRYLVREVAVGDRFTAVGPLGRFHYEPLIDGDDLLFVAGGSGITPFMSMLSDIAHRGWPQRVALIYGSCTVDDVIFGEELKTLAKDSDRFEYDLVISEPPKKYRGHRGFIDRKALRRVDDVAHRTVYICGPGPLYDLVVAELGVVGVPAHRVRRELYGPPADVTAVPGWPEEVEADARFSLEVEGRGTYEAAATEPILVSLERAGVGLPTRCRSGACAACRIKVLQGRVFEPPSARVRISDREHGYTHACTAYPVSDVVVRLP
jgi:ferredoxin-NADP reductase